MAGFGDPTYTSGAGSGQGTGSETNPNQKLNGSAQVPDDAPQDLIDPNDPRLTSEPVEMNLASDAFAQPAPPPDGKYRVKLKLEGVKNDAGETVNYLATGTKATPSVPYFHTGVSGSIIDPSGRYDGIVLRPAFGGYVGTLQTRDGGSKVATLIAKLPPRPDGSPWVRPGEKMNHKSWIELLVKILGGEPEVGVMTQWQVNCQACGEAAKKAGDRYPKGLEGMTHFPQEQDKAKRQAGQIYSPDWPCPVVAGHGYSRARAVIVGFLALSEMVAGR